jgi:hypothetical protein
MKSILSALLFLVANPVIAEKEKSAFPANVMQVSMHINSKSKFLAVA